MIARWWSLALAVALSPPLVTGCDAVSSLFEGNSDSDDDDDDNDDDDKPKKKKEKKSKKAKSPDAALTPFIAQHLEIARQAAGCSGSQPIEPWCTAAAGFTAGTPAKPTKRTHLGLATFVQTKGASPGTLKQHQHLASLSFRSSGSRTFAFIAKVSPDDASERIEVARVESLLLQWFGGGRPPVRVSLGMAGYLDGLPAKTKYEAVAHDHGYAVKGGTNAELRRVGDYWVTAEVPRKNPAGIYFSVFHDTTYR
ncbi:MAG: hypothetical protein JRI68_29855 [Deltaproteobacteria bacterium]|nr:hypothetical protein [Deltaproteobacteria bacterium]